MLCVAQIMAHDFDVTPVARAHDDGDVVPIYQEILCCADTWRMSGYLKCAWPLAMRLDDGPFHDIADIAVTQRRFSILPCTSEQNNVS